MLIVAPAAIGQPATPFQLENLNRYLQNIQIAQNSAITTRQIRLDGYPLFAIAAPTLEGNASTTIDQRVQAIESTLNRIANSDFNPDTLEVVSTIDSSSNLPIITINDRYLMTVTTLDAQLQVTTPERWADELTEIIKAALRRARQERQPEHLMRQGLIAGGILVAIGLISLILSYRKAQLKARQKQLEAEIPDDSVIAEERESSQARSATALRVQQQLKTRQQRNLYDIRRRLVLLLQSIVWFSGILVILDLFPYTRWLRPLLLATPLKLIGILLGTYLLLRVSDLLIDRFFQAVQRSRLLSSEASSQRFALRISTFSRVFRSIAAFVWIANGILISLSVVGVNVVPLLAGAGIIGLAISFAAQSVIKDVINGFLILSEDQYAVGDVIEVGEVSGFVENINLRITQLRDSEGRLITIPNSAISTVQNLSKDWSRVDLAITIAYGTNPDHALAVFRRVSQELYDDREWRSKLLEPPEVLGIDEITHSGLLIRVWIKTQPLQQWLVAREFRRRLRLTMAEADLAIGAPQQYVQLQDEALEESAAAQQQIVGSDRIARKHH